MLLRLMRSGKVYETSIIIIRPTLKLKERYGRDYSTTYARIPKAIQDMFDGKRFRISKMMLDFIEFVEDPEGEYYTIRKGYNHSTMYIRLPIKIEKKRRAVIEIVKKNPLLFRIHLL